MHGMDIDVRGRIMTTLLTHGHTGCICRCMDLATELQRIKDQESRTKAPLAKGQGSRVKDQGAFGIERSKERAGVG